MKNKISILEIKKFLNKKGFIITKKKQIKKYENSLGSLTRTFLTSLVVILFFFITPLLIELTKGSIIFTKSFLDH